MPAERFGTLAAQPAPALDRLCLALAAVFRPVDADAALAELDGLGVEVAALGGTTPAEQTMACRRVLAGRHGFVGDREEYDHPDNSMLDLVLERRRGLPIVLSVVYAEVARRAGVPLRGVGLPGHFVVGHFAADPPLLIDPFNGGVLFDPGTAAALVRPWGVHETTLRVLGNLVASYAARADIRNAIRAANLRLDLPLDAGARVALSAEARTLQAQLN